MATSEWEKVKQLVTDVLEREPGARAAFLDDARLSDEVRAEIESLVGFEDESENLLQLSAVEFAHDFVDEPDNVVGQTIGAYRIISELGHGGMGAVYLAERADGKFAQTVALKLLKRELNTNALRRHFEQEREILATLVHPNIARLLDAGTTDDKIPYIAMEYVDGLPIDEYCNSQNLGVAARLDLFRDVCGAVEYAHRNLVVHRDLKPSNILVTRDGVTKLVDFGISKILSHGYEGADSATITRMGVMTPSYASPEQLKRESVTTLSDVYSLGVILFELLCGRRPFEEREHDLREIYSAVIELDPKPPSSLVRSGPAGADRRPSHRPGEAATERLETRPARVRQTVPLPLPISAQSIRGDLDNIVLKAIRKEPERRYASAGHLSEDIRRHRSGLTVTARPNTFSYRASKFVARNRVGVVAVAIVMLAIVAGVIATLWQNRVARVERAKAEKRFNDVRTLANSFLFEFAPRLEKLPGSTAARQLLVVRALEYLDRLAQESSGNVELQDELAKAYEKVGDVQGSPFSPNIGDTAGALLSYEKSLQIRRGLANSEPGIAYLYKAIGMIHSIGGDYAKAAEFLDPALDLYRRMAEQAPHDTEAKTKLAEMLRQRGLLPFYEGDNKSALEYYHQARELNEQLFVHRPEDPKIAEQHGYIYVAIGEALGWDGDFQGASSQLLKGLALLNDLAKRHPNDPAIQRSLMLAHNKRAENLQDLEQFEESVAEFEKGIAIANAMRRADPQSVLAIRDVAMCNKKIAQAMNDAGRSRESIEKLNLALELFREIMTLDAANTEAPYDVANTRFSIGNSMLTMGDLEAAIGMFKIADTEFKAVIENSPENIYPIRMSCLNLEALGKAYSELSKRKAGEENLRRSVENFELALAGFRRLKDSGNLGEVDDPKLVELEQQITAIRQRLD